MWYLSADCRPRKIEDTMKLSIKAELDYNFANGSWRISKPRGRATKSSCRNRGTSSRRPSFFPIPRLTGTEVFGHPSPAFEVYVENGWWLIDPTRLAPIEGIVRIGSGRDASNIAFLTSDKQCRVIRQSIQVSKAL